MSFNLITDFTGECNVSQNRYATTDYNAIIASIEEKILKSLLGDDLYLKLIATPSTAPYADLVNGKTYSVVNEGGITVNVNYKGIKQMLKYFTYAEILKLQESENTEVGQVEPMQNNSGRVTKKSLGILICSAYNKGVALYGYDIENCSYNLAFISGSRNADRFNKKEYDYWSEIVKGSCYNYLYYCKVNYPSYFPTWQFTIKDEMFLNGYL